MKRILIGFVVLAFIFVLVSCEGMSTTQRRTVGGAAIGAGGGALLGEIIGGRPLAGAALGAGVGALGGYVSGESEEGGYRRGR